jgi:alpha-L-fucosidase
MNVGPNGHGEFDPRAVDALSVYSQWMEKNGESITGCGAAPAEYAAPSGCLWTYNAAKQRLYLHILAWPFEQLHLAGLAGKVEYAQFLHDASEIQFSEPKAEAGEHAALSESQAQGTLTLKLPVKKPGVVVPVIELFLNTNAG